MQRLHKHEAVTLGAARNVTAEGDPPDFLGQPTNTHTRLIEEVVGIRHGGRPECGFIGLNWACKSAGGWDGYPER